MSLIITIIKNDLFITTKEILDIPSLIDTIFGGIPSSSFLDTIFGGTPSSSFSDTINGGTP